MGSVRALMSPAEVKGDVRRATRGRTAERRGGKGRETLDVEVTGLAKGLDLRTPQSK